MTKKFTTEKQFWAAVSERSQALIVNDLESILTKEIATDPDYQAILKNYQGSYYAEQTLNESEPIIGWIARNYLQAIKERIQQHLSKYYEEE